MHEKLRDDEKRLGIINGQNFRKLFIFWKHFNKEYWERLVFYFIIMGYNTAIIYLIRKGAFFVACVASRRKSCSNQKRKQNETKNKKAK